MGLNLNKFQTGKHIIESESYDASNYCPICLYKGRRNAIATIQYHPEINLIFCNNCYGVSASRMPTNNVLIEYYTNYYKNPDFESEKITFHNPLRFSNHLKKLVLTAGFNKNDKITIVDFGGGDGSISLSLAKRLNNIMASTKFEVILVDYIRDDIYYPKNQGLDNITFSVTENLNDINSQADIFIASGVFEHIPNLNTTINTVFNKISNNGLLYARTPYMIPFKKIFKSLDLTYPAHVHQLGYSFWANFIKTFNLNAELLISRPSIVETSIQKNLFRTITSQIFKFPAYIELFLTNKTKNKMFYNLYGAWEVLIKLNTK